VNRVFGTNIPAKAERTQKGGVFAYIYALAARQATVQRNSKVKK